MLAVADRRARGLQDLLGALHSVPGMLLAWLRRRQAVDLLGIEHGGEEHPRPLKLDGLLDRLAPAVEDRLAGRVRLVLILAEFPVLDRRAFLALAHLGIDGRRLLVRHPALVLAALAHELQGVDALVALAGRRIDRHVGAGLARLPRLLPRRGALL